MCCGDVKADASAPFEVGSASFEFLTDRYVLMAEASNFDGKTDWAGVTFVITLSDGSVHDYLAAWWREGKPYQATEKMPVAAYVAFKDKDGASLAVTAVTAKPSFALAVDGSVWGSHSDLQKVTLMAKQYERQGGR